MRKVYVRKKSTSTSSRFGIGKICKDPNHHHLPKEPTVTDKEREDILKFVENVVTEELTDVDILHESEEGAEELINALADAECSSVLLHNLACLDELVPDERDAVHNTLGIVENITEFRPELWVEDAKQGFIQWILKRLKMKMPVDANKLYATEILSILLQNTPEKRKFLGELDGINVLLQELAVSIFFSIYKDLQDFTVRP
ncbi:beta-catenin-like protein 1 isoform X1 [Pieris rapae]|uniref:beta-catenin-like protein 1 isoform X1 n=1 Tax=Pieris rapae TaxID=64459 RepID=UPI001E280ED0|nr:beta-catenin-like protein 1 isoform X1 [Pieris rapae]